jgi:DNA (cytosine-5)-methyltransferase 1
MPPAPRKKSVRISVILTEGDYTRIPALADTNNVSGAWIIRAAVMQFLEEHCGESQLPLKLQRAKKMGVKMRTGAIRRKIARIRAGGKPRLLDLFAGCGGLSLGFQAAGYALQAAVEFDSDAARSHGLNFHGGDARHSQARDIITTHPEDLAAELELGPEADAVDIIIGGPPCQAFARVGRPKLREIDAHPQAFRNDPRARLYQEYLRYVGAFQPLAVLVENVPDVLNHGGQNIAEEICEVLEAKGYVCGYTLLNAAFYGVPQMRERMFLVAYRREIADRVTFPDPTNWLVLPPGYEGSRAVALKVLNGCLEEAHHYNEPPIASPKLAAAVTAEDALRDLPPIYARQQLAAGELRRGARRFDQPVPYDTKHKVSAYGRLMRSWPGFEAPEEGLRDHVIRYLPRDYEYQRLRDAIVPPYDATKFPNKWRKMWRDQPARTLMAHLGKDSYSHIHYDSEQARTISVREAARLQSFPDGFVFCGTMNPAFRQIGNAVPPLMARALAETMMIALRGREEQNNHVGRRAAAAV